MQETDWLSNALNYISRFEFFGSFDIGDLALLMARIILAIIFLSSFNNKYKDVAGFAKQNKLPLPAGYLQVAIEGLAGELLLLGFLTQIGALLAMAAMTGAMYFHIFKWKSKYWAASGGWEYDLMIFTLAFLILVTVGGLLGIYPTPELSWLPFV